MFENKRWIYPGHRQSGLLQRLNDQLAQENNRLRQVYAQLGEQYYKSFGEHPAPEFAQLIEEIGQVATCVDKLEQQVLEAKGQRKCPYCKAIISNQSTHCTVCGRRVAGEDQMACPSCHRLVKKDSIFCTFCGNQLQYGTTPGEQPALYRCRMCHRVVEKGNRYCPYCGTQVLIANQKADAFGITGPSKGDSTVHKVQVEQDTFDASLTEVREPEMESEETKLWVPDQDSEAMESKMF